MLALGGYSNVAATSRWIVLRPENLTPSRRTQVDPKLATILATAEKNLGKESVVDRLVAPDGQKVAIYHRRTATRFSLTLITSTQTAPIAPVSPDLDVGSIAWHPNSTVLAFVTAATGSFGSTVWQYDLQKGQRSRLAHFGDQQAYALAWNRQGNVLALLLADQAHAGDRYHGNLVLVAQDGGIRQLTTNFAMVSPSWSPSGQMVAAGNEALIGEPKSESGISVFGLDGKKIRHEPSPGIKGADPDSQVDRVIWESETTILVRFSVFRGSGAAEEGVRWFKLILQ
jgi:dipeptidyl aminopeptidase/acylaminoacyl peptidase